MLVVRVADPPLLVLHHGLAGVDDHLAALLRGRGRSVPVAGADDDPGHIRDALDELGRPRRLAVVDVAPMPSRVTTGPAHRHLRAAVGDRTRVHEAPPWHTHPAWVGLVADLLASTLADVSDDAHVLFTARSLPVSVMGDPAAPAVADRYPMMLRETAAAVSDRLGLRRRTIAWHGAGSDTGTDGPWLKPDVGDVLDALANAHGLRTVVLCPVGQAADTLDVTTDLDTTAAAHARDLGVQLVRVPTAATSGRFVPVLADVATDLLDDLGEERR